MLTPLPHNWHVPDPSPAAIQRDVDYALKLWTGYRYRIPGAWFFDKEVLELGPGYSLGSPLLLACAGARVTVADPYPPHWEGLYHRRFCWALLKALRSRGETELSPEPLLAAIEGNCLPPRFVTRVVASATDLQGLPSGRFDAILSNAVLEHVPDVADTLRELARLTAPAGFNVHQIDFRDHRDMTRPLEFLTLDRATFEAEFRRTHGECGNRTRPAEVARLAKSMGFALDHSVVTERASATYLAELRLRLDADWADLPDDALDTLGACYVWTLPATPHAERLAVFAAANTSRWARLESTAVDALPDRVAWLTRYIVQRSGRSALRAASAPRLLLRRVLGRRP